MSSAGLYSLPPSQDCGALSFVSVATRWAPGYTIRLSGHAFIWAPRVIGPQYPNTTKDAATRPATTKTRASATNTRRDDRLPALGTAVRPQVGAGQKQHGENPIDDVKQPDGRVSGNEEAQPKQALDGGEAGHDQVARPESAADLRVSEIAV